MKISLYIKISGSGKKVVEPETFNKSYLYEGHLCSVIVYGHITQPKIQVVPPGESSLPLDSKYLFFISIYWSRINGFKFTQYTDPEITTSLISTTGKQITTSLIPTTGKLKGGDRIQINKNLATITFKAEVNQEDLGNIDSKVFIEKCSQFGIRVVDTKFLNLNVPYGLACTDSQLVNVEFYEARIEGANFCNSDLSNVKFVNSVINNSRFNNATFFQIEFDNVKLINSVFDNCRVKYYSKIRIENDGYLLFKNACDLTGSSFVNASFSSKFENANLSRANFSDATLVACKFYDCTLISTIFTRAKFNSFKPKKETMDSELINCCISNEKILNGDNEKQKPTINDCKFDNASMPRVDLSNNIIKDTNFEATDLYRANLYNCQFINTSFKRATSEAASLREVSLSNSIFAQKCNLTEVIFDQAKMIGVTFNDCQLIRASFYSGNLRGSEFISSDLTGADFRYADLTLLTLDKCHLNSANFFQTKRGGINLKTTKEDKNGDNSESNKEVLWDSSCTFDCIEWSANIDGEIQIDRQSFLNIISGHISPVAVISNLSQENAQFILNTYATAESSAKSVENDSSMNISGEVNDSSIVTGNIEDNSREESEQDEDNNQEIDQSSTEDLSPDESSDENNT
ncbi:pentapeptide repeat-containing protein [Moorena sp. SIO3B2]|uniref:pentapeptide repeat-containing protein n=1 Tax=Moorena sp. SIO3B2 TaxID=2607827 RepID=UPI0013C71E8B|nr:pentapeptide repeat-containing protein [Moorena sp. SIO3B2]NEP32951.1 pentapeptide repeat-containing protein [Moorena sp. SIO3B2]